MTVTAQDHGLMLQCRDQVLDTLRRTAGDRSDPDWEHRERFEMAVSANEFAFAHGKRTISANVVEMLEPAAMGHCDYASKIALYIAEYVMGWRNVGDDDMPPEVES